MMIELGRKITIFLSGTIRLDRWAYNLHDLGKPGDSAMRKVTRVCILPLISRNIPIIDHYSRHQNFLPAVANHMTGIHTNPLTYSCPTWSSIPSIQYVSDWWDTSESPALICRIHVMDQIGITVLLHVHHAPIGPATCNLLTLH